jgi:hypothetical protein
MSEIYKALEGQQPQLTTEAINWEVNLAAYFPGSISLSAVSVKLEELPSGTDVSISTLLQPPSVAGMIVTQRVEALVAGLSYRLVVTATGQDLNTETLYCFIKCER